MANVVQIKKLNLLIGSSRESCVLSPPVDKTRTAGRIYFQIQIQIQNTLFILYFVARNANT